MIDRHKRVDYFNIKADLGIVPLYLNLILSKHKMKTILIAHLSPTQHCINSCFKDFF
jgi:hypothetical protein